MDKLKYIKIEDEDGNLSDNIPIGADAKNIDLSNGINLQSKINNIDGNIDNLKIIDSDLQTQIASNKKSIQSLADGSPKGTYKTTDALIDANPSTGTYIITSNGHLYSWTKDGDTAIDLGVYQAIGLADNSIYPKHLQFTSARRLIPQGLITIDTKNSTITLPNTLYVHSEATKGWGALIRASDYPDDYPEGKFIFKIMNLTNLYFDFDNYHNKQNPFILKTLGGHIDQVGDRYIHICEINNGGYTSYFGINTIPIQIEDNSIYPKHLQFSYEKQLFLDAPIELSEDGRKVVLPSMFFHNSSGWYPITPADYPEDFPSGKFEFIPASPSNPSRIYFDSQAYAKGENPFIFKKDAHTVDQENDRYILIISWRRNGCISNYGVKVDTAVNGLKITNNTISESKLLFDTTEFIVMKDLIKYENGKITIPEFWYKDPGTKYGTVITPSSYQEDYPDGKFEFTVNNVSSLYFDRVAYKEGKNPLLFKPLGGTVQQVDHRYLLIFRCLNKGYECPFGVVSNITIDDYSLPSKKLKVFNEREQELLLPEKMWMVNKQPYRLYKKSMVLNPKDDKYYDLSLLSSMGDKLPYTEYINEKIDIYPEQIGSNLKFGISSDLYQNYGNMFSKELNIIKTDVSTLSNKQMNWIMFGDSLTAGGIPSWVSKFGKQIGLTLTSKGTTAASHEGRGSYCFAHYIGLMTVLSYDNTSPSANLPFLKLATETDKKEHPTWCFTKTHTKKEKSYQEVVDEAGDLSQDFYIFDFDYYVTQQGYTDINTVILAMGTNDWWQFGKDDEALEIINLAYKIISTKIWEYDSNIKIGVIPLFSKGTEDSFNYRSTSHSIRLGKQLDVLIEEYPNIDIIGAWMSHSSEITFPYEKTLDLDHGVSQYSQKDNTHPTAEGYKEIAMPIMYYLAHNLVTEQE